MKRFLSTITILALAPLLTIQTASAQFTDLFKNNKNYEAIIFLEENNILVGYPDGTFRPTQEVNRAEFLKIILEGSNIPLDKNDLTLPFPDTQDDKWYLPYIQKAYSEEWIVGFSDGTFRPSQTIKKTEALKILGEVQQWETNENPTYTQFTDIDLDEWYAKYVVYASENNYLEEDEELFEPLGLMTRANISEIIYRTMILGDNGEIQIEDDTEPDVEPVSYKEIPTDFYDNITLDQSLPNTFYKNEVYVVKGQVDVSGYEEVSIFLDNNMYVNADYLLFTGEIENGKFEIPIHLRKSGNYTIGIIPGVSGNTKIEDVSILDQTPQPTKATGELENLKIKYENDITSLEFDAPTDTTKIFTFEQGTDKVEFISRQNFDSIPLLYSTFDDFKEGEVTYFGQLSNPDTTTEEKTFDATQHTFDKINEDKISAEIPDTLNKYSDISFSGTIKSDIQTEGLVINTNGLVETVQIETTSPTSTYFDATIIEDGSDFTFEYDTSENGTYIVEILDQNGIPIVNHPIYIGGMIPLIPDYFDLNERVFFEGNFDIDDLREDLLNEINKDRAAYDYPEIALDPELNDLAQEHSEDMAENDFFGHINLSNQTPNDRRIEAEIETPVSENIAKDVSILFSHLGLMRSGSHRENILNPNWYLVGLGIAEAEGYLYVTEEFSAGKISESQLAEYATEMVEAVNTLREDNGISALTSRSDIDQVCTYLNEKTISEDITLTTTELSAALELHNIAGTSQYIGRTYNVWSVILSSILTDEESSILDESWVNIGVDIQLDETGMIYASFMLNK
jgi:uncharacterized protein YkwD